MYMYNHMSLSNSFMATILEQSKISPPPNTAPPTSLPLTFFDLPWLFFPPNQTLFFFEYPFPNSHFLSFTLPNLKYSLSLTLQQFFPLAGNLTVPGECDKPKIVYAEGDYVLLTIAESNDDFNHLSGNGQRNGKEFYSLVPELASGEQALLPLLAVQVTVFSSFGICLGFAYHRVAADGRTFNHFLKMWSLFHGDSSFSFKSLPVYYDRLIIKDPIGLEEIFLNEWCKRKSKSSQGTIDLSTRVVRATFLVSPSDMEKIKQWIILECKKKNRSEPTHLSPFNLTCAFTWVCYAKAQAEVKGNKSFGGQDPSYFGFNAGAITRLDYLVPANYFGNCIGFARCMATMNELLGEDGIIFAANVIGNKIKALDKAILEGAEKWVSDYEVFYDMELHFMVSGSPKLDFYETDFGWGRPKKIEEISIDQMRAISLTESRNVKGGIEVGLALPKVKMDAFTSIVSENLNVLSMKEK